MLNLFSRRGPGVLHYFHEKLYLAVFYFHNDFQLSIFSKAEKNFEIKIFAK